MIERFIESLPSPALLTECDGSIAAANTHAENLLGYHDEGLKGKHASLLYPGFIDARNTGTCSCEMICSNGEKIPALLESSPWNCSGTRYYISIFRKQDELPAFLQYSQTIFNHARDGIVVINKDHKVIAVNPSFCRMLGYTEDELLSKYTWDYEALLDEDAVRNKFTSPDLINMVIETKHRRKDKSMYDVEVSITGIPNHAEGLFLCICRDISEKKQSEKDREEASRQVRDILERIKDAFISINTSWDYTYINDRAAEMIGRVPEELVGKNLWDQFPEFENIEIGKAVMRSMKEKKHGYIEDYDPILKIWIEVYIYYSDNGLSIFFHDVTEKVTARKEAEFQHQFQQLIAETSSDFIRISESTFEEKIDKMLNRFGEFFMIDRSYLILYSKDGSTLSMTNEWCASGIQSYASMYQDFPVERYSWLYRKLQTGEPVIIQDVKSMLEESSNEKNDFIKQGIKSLFCYPIYSRDKFVGVFGFDSVRGYRSWDKKLISLFLIAANILADALHKQTMEKEISLQRIRLENIIEGTNVGTWQWDVKTGELLLNERWASMLGYTLEELSPHTISLWKELTHPDDYRRSSQKMRQLLEREDTYFEDEMLMRHKEGRWVWIYRKCSVVTWSDKNEPLVVSGTHQDISERKHYENLMRYIIEHTRSSIAVHDRNLNYIFVSQRYLEEFNIKDPDIIGKHHYDVIPDLPQAWKDVHQRCLRGEIISKEVDPYPRSDGTVEWTNWECRPWYESDGAIGGIIIYTEVITERKNAEEHRTTLQEKLAQTSKMESVGRLAGGVAHDFNNMLQAIIGHTELALDHVDSSHPSYGDLKVILQAAGKSAHLTRQLLAYARQQAVVPQIINMNKTVMGMTSMLKRLIGEDIELILKPEKGLWNIRMDPAQIDQILVNLCVNSRDAIHLQGSITIITKNIHTSSGDFVQLTVSDSGIGMSQMVLENALEPFFTTKDIGDGTGLGLSIAYGIVTQNGGDIQIESTPHEGTAVRIIFPRSSDEEHFQKPDPHAHHSGQDSLTVMVVEDDPLVLSLVTSMLKKMNHQVLAAHTAEQAISFAEDAGRKFDMVVTDIMMPVMNGFELSKIIHEKWEDMPILYMSGYAADAITDRGMLSGGLHFIQKPFSYRSFSQKIREVLSV